MRIPASQLGWLTMLAAVVTVLVADNASAEAGVGLAVVTLLLGGWALRQAVRTNAGVAHALFGLGFGFVALVAAVFILGGQNGGTYTGLGPALQAVPVVGAAAV